MAQRQNRHSLSSAQVAKLNQLQFVWATTSNKNNKKKQSTSTTTSSSTGSREAHWMRMYEQLKVVQDDFGYGDVSMEVDDKMAENLEEYGALRRWVQTQRRNHYQMKESHRELLNEIGMDWSLLLGEEEEETLRPTSTKSKPKSKTTSNKPSSLSLSFDFDFDDMVQQVKDFYQETGHFVVLPDTPQHTALYQWMRQQRQLYKENRLSETDQAKLEAIDFVWCEAEALQAQNDWEVNFDKLTIFKEVKGHTYVQRDDDIALWRWAEKNDWKQRSNKLPKQQNDRLDSIGFWDPPPPLASEPQPPPQVVVMEDSKVGLNSGNSKVKKVPGGKKKNGTKNNHKKKQKHSQSQKPATKKRATIERRRRRKKPAASLVDSDDSDSESDVDPLDNGDDDIEEEEENENEEELEEDDDDEDSDEEEDSPKPPAKRQRKTGKSKSNNKKKRRATRKTDDDDEGDDGLDDTDEEEEERKPSAKRPRNGEGKTKGNNKKKSRVASKKKQEHADEEEDNQKQPAKRPRRRSTREATNENDDNDDDDNDDDGEIMEEEPSETIEEDDSVFTTPYQVGTKVRKRFGSHGWYHGEIISIYEENIFKIRYEDQDEETYEIPREQKDLDAIIANAQRLRRHKVGTPVKKLFGNHGWFTGKIVDVQKDSYKVRYEDQDEETFPVPAEKEDLDQIVANARLLWYDVGTKVKKDFEEHGWFEGVIIAMRDDRYVVRYEDGDKEEYLFENDLPELDSIVGSAKSK